MKLKWAHTERLGKGGATDCKEDNAIMANNDLSAVLHKSLSTIAPNQESTCSINIKSMWTTTKTNLFVHSGNPYLLGLRFCHCCSCWINIDPKVLRETANGVLIECYIDHLVKINHTYGCSMSKQIHPFFTSALIICLDTISAVCYIMQFQYMKRNSRTIPDGRCQCQ